VLYEEWLVDSGLQNPGNLKVILRSFILELSSRLRNIPEIRAILTDRDIQEMRAIVGEINEKATDISQAMSLGSYMYS
jgi:hypothetical protein